MGQLIKLTVFRRNTKPVANIAALFDVDDITSPIRFLSGKSTFAVKPKSEDNRAGNRVTYQVNEALAAVKATSGKLVLLSVTSRNRRTVVTESYLFNVSKMSEIVANGSGAKFLYTEHGNPLPVEYTVTQNLDNILAQASELILTTTAGLFNTPDANNALAINVGGVIKYVQLVQYP